MLLAACDRRDDDGRGSDDRRVVQGRLWQSGAPWLESVQASRPYWMVRTLAAVPVAGGFIALLAGLTTGPRGGGLTTVEDSVGAEPVDEISPRLAPVAGGSS